jgi:outer membrane protein OmpU
MKKVLLATSALVAFAGAASAEMSISGYAWAGLVNSSNNAVAANDGSEFQSGLRMHFNAATQTDSGLSFKVYARMIEQDGDGGTLDRTKLTVSSNGLSIAVGNTNGAMRSLARTVASYGFNDGSNSLFDTAQSIQNDAAGQNAYLSYSASGFTVGISSNTDMSTTEIAAAYSSNGFSVAAGVDSDDRWMAKAGYSANGMSFTLGANEAGDLVAAAGFEVSASTSIAIAYEDRAAQANANGVAGAAAVAAGQAFGIQLTQDLGAGASLVADMNRGFDDSNNVGVGVVFNF